MKFINDRVHGALDYVVAVALIAVPLWEGFQVVSQFAHWFSIAAGVGLFVYSLITSYSLSAKGLISFELHLLLDFIAGLALILVPFIYGIEGVPQTFFMVIGTFVLVLVFFTNPNVDSGGPIEVAETETELETDEEPETEAETEAAVETET